MTELEIEKLAYEQLKNVGDEGLFPNHTNGDIYVRGFVDAFEWMKSDGNYDGGKIDWTTVDEVGQYNARVEDDALCNRRAVDLNVDEYIQNKQNKADILGILLTIIQKDHPEFEEEGTTGWDVIENANLWLSELT